MNACWTDTYFEQVKELARLYKIDVEEAKNIIELFTYKKEEDERNS